MINTVMHFPGNRNIKLLPVCKEGNLDAILSATDSPRLYATDFYVSGCEGWVPRPWGWEIAVGERRMFCVDHHAQDPKFYRRVSTGPLAIDYINANGIVPEGSDILLNHTDCDSVLSALMLCGDLQPLAKFGEAAIASDHTGEKNEIADLLLGLDSLRDFELSYRNLHRLLRGEPLDEIAYVRLARRESQRKRAAELVASGAFERFGKVFFTVLAEGESIPGEFLPAKLPEAWVIVFQRTNDAGQVEARMRLGLAAPAGVTLFSLGLEELEPAFGGRWNAGGTSRAGGSTVPPRVLAQQLAERIGL